MPDTIIKAFADGYDPEPFFFYERPADDVTRLVGWTNSLESFKRIVYYTLSSFPQKVEVSLSND